MSVFKIQKQVSLNEYEVVMKQKSLIVPERKRMLKPPFAWIDRRYMFNGFFAELSNHENLLYFFLTLVADNEGLSYYSYDKICQLLKLDLNDYIRARNTLLHKQLIASDGRQFQVLSLPARQNVKRYRQDRSTDHQSTDGAAQALSEIFARMINKQV
jgi:hypothetical protein